MNTNTLPAPSIRLPAERWERLPPYMDDGKPGNLFPVGYVTSRYSDGSPCTSAIPVEVRGKERADQVVAALNVASDPRVANARTLYESVTKGATLTGNAARLAFQLGNVLAAIDGQAPSPYAPPPRDLSLADWLSARLAKSLPCDEGQRESLIALRARLLAGNEMGAPSFPRE